MGRSGTYNYEIQVQLPGTQKLLLLGAMRFQEAEDKLLTEAMRLNSNIGYIWPQTKIARAKINNLSFVNNHRGIDYLKYTIELNTRERKKYTTSGLNIMQEANHENQT